jgi:SAM-dependent methyltransferase
MFNCPLSPDKADRLIDALALPAAARVVDVGCGTGEFLVRLVERCDAGGTGIDPDADALRQCRRRCEGRIPAERLDLHPVEAAAFAWPDQPFDAAICIGSTHAYGGFVPALRELAGRVRAGGVVLIGDLFWQKPPGRESRDVIGDDGWPPEDADYAAGLRHGWAEGLTPLYSVPSSPDEWDHFEGNFAARGYRRAYALPSAGERRAALERTRRWQAAYVRWGRETMGFGFYVFLKPPAMIDG